MARRLIGAKGCNMKRIIEIWGTYPPPIGGVSIHVKRLFERLLETDLKDDIILKNFHGKCPYNSFE